MQSASTINFRSFVIKPNGTINKIVLNFDKNINQPLIKVINSSTMELIKANMKSICDCNHYKLNIVRAIYPDNTYYSIFYEADTENSKKEFNKIASTITKNKCYGNCYIVHINTFYELIDTDAKTFIDRYNSSNSQSQIIIDPKKLEPKKSSAQNISKSSDPRTNKCRPHTKKNNKTGCVIS